MTLSVLTVSWTMGALSMWLVYARGVVGKRKKKERCMGVNILDNGVLLCNSVGASKGIGANKGSGASMGSGTSNGYPREVSGGAVLFVQEVHLNVLIDCCVQLKMNEP